MTDIPNLGLLEKDEENDNWLISQPVAVKVLGGKKYCFILEGYEEEDDKEAYHQAIANFLTIDDSVLKQAQDAIYLYYKDLEAVIDEDEIIKINNPNDIWRHIQLDCTPIVKRRRNGDKAIYILLECECDWEPEHGLQIVFKKGLSINKVGPFDDQLSNADSYANPKLESVVYYSPTI